MQMEDRQMPPRKITLNRQGFLLRFLGGYSLFSMCVSFQFLHSSQPGAAGNRRNPGRNFGGNIWESFLPGHRNLPQLWWFYSGDWGTQKLETSLNESECYSTWSRGTSTTWEQWGHSRGLPGRISSGREACLIQNQGARTGRKPENTYLDLGFASL